MSVDVVGKKGKERGIKEYQQMTRRQFLKESSLIVGSVAIASMAITSACSSPDDTTTPNTTTNTSINTTKTTTTTPKTTTTTTTPTSTSLPPAEGFVYTTPLEQPPVMEIPGCTTRTATDRKYVIEHMWIKMVAENIVAIGITEKMADLTAVIYDLDLPPIGSTLKKGDFFAYAEAAKMNVEFPAPISGTVLQLNNGIYFDLGATVNGSPYEKGWFLTMQLSDSEEWNELLTPQEYTDLNAKDV